MGKQCIIITKSKDALASNRHEVGLCPWVGEGIQLQSRAPWERGIWSQMGHRHTRYGCHAHHPCLGWGGWQRWEGTADIVGLPTGLVQSGGILGLDLVFLKDEAAQKLTWNLCFAQIVRSHLNSIGTNSLLQKTSILAEGTAPSYHERHLSKGT